MFGNKVLNSIWENVNNVYKKKEKRDMFFVYFIFRICIDILGICDKGRGSVYYGEILNSFDIL